VALLPCLVHTFARDEVGIVVVRVMSGEELDRRTCMKLRMMLGQKVSHSFQQIGRVD